MIKFLLKWILKNQKRKKTRKPQTIFTDIKTCRKTWTRSFNFVNITFGLENCCVDFLFHLSKHFNIIIEVDCRTSVTIFQICKLIFSGWNKLAFGGTTIIKQFICMCGQVRFISSKYIVITTGTTKYLTKSIFTVSQCFFYSALNDKLTAMVPMINGLNNKPFKVCMFSHLSQKH